MARSLKKRTICRRKLTEESGRDERKRTEDGHQDLVPPFHHLPADGFPYNCSS